MQGYSDNKILNGMKNHYSDIYTEKIILLDSDKDIIKNSNDAIMQSISMNNAVGTIGGYYDDDLTMLFISDFFLHNLGYSFDEFSNMTGVSLKKMIYPGDLKYFENQSFRNGSGAGLFHMMMSDGTPIYVRTFKTESTDKNGTPIWVMSVRVAWDAQNVELVNGIMQSGVWYIDFNDDDTIRKVTWSQKFRQMLGFSGPADFPDTLEAWEERIHPHDRQKVMEKFYAAISDRQNETKYIVEYRARAKDGKYHWFKESAEVNRRLNGSASRMTGIFVNIDEEHKTRKENEKNAAFHRSYSKSNLCEFYVDLQDDTFEVLKFNEKLLKEYGSITSWDEIAGKYVNEHVCEDSRDSIRLLFDRDYIRKELIKLDGEISLECHAKYNGADYWVRNLVLPGDMDENGKPRHAIVFLRDITNAKKAEEELHRMSQDNHDMDELLSGMVKLVKRFAVCDLEHGSYTLHNLDGVQLLKTSGTYDEMVADLSSKFKALSDNETISDLMSRENLTEKLSSETDIYNFEYCSNDEKLFKNMSAIPLEFSNGRLTRVLMIIQDVTQAKNNEREARAALKDAFLAAERANKAKTVFMSNMSHDIRTPMNAIIGMTEIAGAHIDDKERVLNCLGKITNSSRHLLSLINEVLDMSQIERGGISLVQEEFHLPDLIDDLLTLTKSSAEQHKHEISVSLSDIRHENVTGDRLRIQQVLANIMSNAVKYTPDGGKIHLGISEKFSRGNSSCFEFTIADNGIGMTEEFQKVIFEPFTRADDNRTTKIPGTGLGMAITKNIVDMMNGTITVDSEYGKGTCFTVSIVLRTQDSEDGPSDKLADLPVLVVGDDREYCEGAVTILDEIGMNGEWVTSGEEAVQRTVDRHSIGNDYFAVIIDWKTPSIDGIETTREIRRRVGSAVPTIVFTAYDCSAVEKEAREAGANAFITKPLFRSRLTALFKGLVSPGARISSVTDAAGKICLTGHSGKNVLIVEDNELNREIATEIISMTGAHVEAVENGMDAVNIIRQKGAGYYDIVFMDIQMPVMNGYQATEEIRIMPGCSDLPIVAMTANAFAEDVLRAKNAGMNGHISKPLELKKLNDVMNKWLRKA